MANYRLTRQAEQDLQRIYAHGIRTYGETQADKYFMAFFDQFEQIARSPGLFQSVDYIRAGYRRSVCGVDSIYYRIGGDGIVEIMTILGRQDIRAALGEDD